MLAVFQILAVIGFIAVAAMLLSIIVILRSTRRKQQAVRKRAVKYLIASLTVGAVSCITAFALGWHQFVL